MFSVIIPVYNKSRYIEKCIESVFNQTFSEFEIIVVDDGSADNSLEKVRMLIDRSFLSPENEEQKKVQQGKNGKKEIFRLKKSFTDPNSSWDIRLTLIHQENQGVSAARNNGVREAVSDYIAFLDADDWWENTYLEEMNSLIAQFPEAAIFSCNYFKVKGKLRNTAKIGVEKNFDRGLINYFQVYAKTMWMPVWTGATIVSREVFNLESGFNPQMHLGEDLDLWIRMALKYPLAFLNKPLSNYNQDVESAKRATGNIHDPSHHVLWNLDYLTDKESSNPELKQLLDNLRVYSLFPYYLKNEMRGITQKELNKVDWEKQPAHVVRKYRQPVWFLQLLQFIRETGSSLKNLVRNGSSRIFSIN